MMNEYYKIKELGKKAKSAALYLANLSHTVRNKAILMIAKEIQTNKNTILKANQEDISQATVNMVSKSVIDRLLLTDNSITSMVRALQEISQQPDPLHCILSHVKRPSGLDIKAVSIPLGVIAVIYEARPNVTVDAVGLCLKSGNSVILRGGSESIHSNQAIISLVNKALRNSQIGVESVQIMPTQDRDAIRYLVSQDNLVDVVIPRGGEALIKYLNKHSRVPLFKHLNGLCHTYIHHSASIQKTKKLCLNAKMRRPSICSATETILIDNLFPKENIRALLLELSKARCELRLDHNLWEEFPFYQKAIEADWSKEYLDNIVSIKNVEDIHAAIKHINHYGSHHTDAIITEDDGIAKLFMQSVDSSVVMHNTSTQFSDGGEFGMGAEIGISTNKLHARGPIGAKQLTTFKYKVVSDGCIRP